MPSEADQGFYFMAGTTANAVMPGVTRTDAFNRHAQEEFDKVRQEYLPLQSMPRVREPEDVADVVGLLCRKDARWITGSVIFADRGGTKIL